MKNKLYKTKEEIENWLNQYEITNYELIEDFKYGYVVNVNEDVDLSNKKIEEIPIKFNIIKGAFLGSGNLLKNLKFAPVVVESMFLRYNKLKSLKGAPNIVKGIFDVSDNQLNNLDYSPKKVKVILANRNKIKTLKGCTKELVILELDFNEIDSLEFIPNNVLSSISLYENKKEIYNKIKSYNDLLFYHKQEMNLILHKKLDENVNILTENKKSIKL